MKISQFREIQLCHRVSECFWMLLGGQHGNLEQLEFRNPYVREME